MDDVLDVCLAFVGRLPVGAAVYIYVALCVI